MKGQKEGTGLRYEREERKSNRYEYLVLGKRYIPPIKRKLKIIVLLLKKIYNINNFRKFTKIFLTYEKFHKNVDKIIFIHICTKIVFGTSTRKIPLRLTSLILEEQRKKSKKKR